MKHALPRRIAKRFIRGGAATVRLSQTPISQPALPVRKLARYERNIVSSELSWKLVGRPVQLRIRVRQDSGKGASFLLLAGDWCGPFVLCKCFQVHNREKEYNSARKANRFPAETNRIEARHHPWFPNCVAVHRRRAARITTLSLAKIRQKRLFPRSIERYSRVALDYESLASSRFSILDGNQTTDDRRIKITLVNGKRSVRLVSANSHDVVILPATPDHCTTHALAPCSVQLCRNGATRGFMVRCDS